MLYEVITVVATDDLRRHVDVDQPAGWRRAVAPGRDFREAATDRERDVALACDRAREGWRRIAVPRPERERVRVITSYSIHYTKLYD